MYCELLKFLPATPSPQGFSRPAWVPASSHFINFVGSFLLFSPLIRIKLSNFPSRVLWSILQMAKQAWRRTWRGRGDTTGQSRSNWEPGVLSLLGPYMAAEDFAKSRPCPAPHFPHNLLFPSVLHSTPSTCSQPHKGTTHFLPGSHTTAGFLSFPALSGLHI